MKFSLIPGYKELFGNPDKTYDELLKDIPSEIIISFLVVLNNELNAPTSQEENQKRLIGIVSRRFSDARLSLLEQKYRRFRVQTKGVYKGDVFARRYIIAMILKEIERNSNVDLNDTSSEHEYNFLLAYLMVINEINTKDDTTFKKNIEFPKDEFHLYKLMWTSQISQYQFNERTDIIFEILKLISFTKYASENYKPFLKEYLNSLKFKTIGRFITSFYQGVQSTLHYNKNDALSKLSYIKPNADNTHLKELSINKMMGQRLTLADFKKYPLFLNERNGFMIMDHDIYYRKIYRGPFFELYYKTTLNNGIKFNTYSNLISKKVLESITFQSIIRTLKKSHHSFLYFDDESESVPDCYYRHNKTIFLIEFKGYIFPEGIPENPDFNTIKKYIDDRFIENKEGKPKGISQIINQINLLKDNKFDFDQSYKNELYKKHITIIPIICFDEFHFTMPGVNDYLNEQFKLLLSAEKANDMSIKDLTLINLDILFDFSMKGGDFKKLEQYIERYWKILNRRFEKFKISKIPEDHLRSKASFDEIYNTLFALELKKSKNTSDLKLAEIIGNPQHLDESF